MDIGEELELPPFYIKIGDDIIGAQRTLNRSYNPHIETSKRRKGASAGGSKHCMIL